MDTTQLLTDAKARFSHNSAKAYLNDKYSSKLIIAEQGGLWTAAPALITFLHSMPGKTLVVIDNFDNPVAVDRKMLLDKLRETYTGTMTAWHSEWQQLESKR